MKTIMIIGLALLALAAGWGFQDMYNMATKTGCYANE